MKRILKFIGCLALCSVGLSALAATKQVTDQDTLNAAVAAAAAGDVIEITTAGTYKVPSPTSAIKIVGVDGVVFNAIDAQYGQSVGQATGTEFENVKFAFGTSLYTGFQHSSYVAFTKCSFTGRFNSYGEMHFTECSFEAPSGDYSMWLYAGDTYFKDCTFSGDGKFFNVYNEGNTTVPWIVEFDGCTFSSSKSNKAALNVKSTCGAKGLKYAVTVNNCKIDPNGDKFPAASVSDTLIVFNGLIQLDDISASTPNEITITQDGKVLYAENAVVSAPAVQVEVEENNAKGITTVVVQEIVANEEVAKVEQAAIAEAIKEDVAGKDEAVVKVTLQEVKTEANKTTLQFVVAPYIGAVQVDNDNIKGAVPFRLPLLKEKFVEYAKISHEGDPDRFVLVKKGANGEPYVDVALTHFSTVLASVATEAEMVPEGAVKIQDGLWGANGATDMGHAEIVYSVGATGLKAFRDWVNEGNSGEGKTFQLVADVDLAGEEWTPIASDSNRFKGTFDGLGKTIDNLKVNALAEFSGLFSVLEGGQIKDLVLANVDVSGASSVGALVGCVRGDGVVDGVTVASGKIVNNGGEGKRAGGIVGQIRSTGKIFNCTNNATVSGKKNSGGIVGAAYYIDSTTQTIEDCVISNCVNNGDVTSSSSGAGGIVSLSIASVRDCVNNGKILSSGSYAGGLVASSMWTFGEVVRCVNNGEVVGTSAIGGIYGWLQNSGSSTDYKTPEKPLIIRGNVNNGKVTANEMVAGIVGKIGSGTGADKTSEVVLLENENNGAVVAGGAEGYGLLCDATIVNRSVVNNVSTATTAPAKLVTGWNTDLAKANSTAWVAADADGNKYATVAYAISQGLGTPAKPFALLADATIELTAADETYNFIANGHKVTVVSKVADMVGITSAGENGQMVAKLVAALTKGEGDKYHITNLDELKAFRAMVNVSGMTFKEETIVLDADIDLGNENWEPIGTEAKHYSGVLFDGQNHKISNLKIRSSNSYQGLFGFVKEDPNHNDGVHSWVSSFRDLVIENVDIVITVVGTPSGCGALIGYESQGAEISNVKVTGSVNIQGHKWVGGIVGYGDVWLDNCVVEDTTADGGLIAASEYSVGGIIGMQGNANAKVDHVVNCTVSNVVISGNQRIGGIVGVTNGEVLISSNEVSGVTFATNENSTRPVMYSTFGLILGADNNGMLNTENQILSNLLLDNQVENITVPAEQEFSMAGGKAGDGSKPESTKAIVGNDVVISGAKIVSGTFDQLPSGVLAPGSVMDIDPTTGKIVVLGPLVADENGVYHIATLQDLNVFRLMVNGGNTFAGKTVVLDDDIDFVGMWDTGIGGIFRGVFDGQDHTIANLKITKGVESGTYSYAALFHTVYGPGENDFACVRNLTLTDVAVSATGEYVAAISGDAQFANFENCKVIGGSIAGLAQVGGICGFTRGCNVTGCLVENVTISAVEDRAAGIVGGKMQSGGSIVGNTVKSCLITSGGYHTEYCGAAGLVGQIHFTDGTSAAITDNEILDVTNKVADATINAPIGNFRCDCENKLSATTIARNHWAPATVPDSCEVHHKGGVLPINNFHPVAEIAGKGPEYRYETVPAALDAAAALPGTVEVPTVVQLYPGEVLSGPIQALTCNLKNVVVQGAADGTSTIKDSQLAWQSGLNEFENVTFKNIIFDNSHVVFSTNSKEKDLFFIGNTFRNIAYASNENRGGVHFNSPCQNLTYENNVFEGSVPSPSYSSIAAINTKNVTGNITIRNNVFKNSCWRSIQLMFNSNDGIDDNITITDNWIVGNAANIQIVASGTTAGDTVGFNISYNVFDETDDSMYLYNTNPSKTVLAMDHNYWSMNPDSNSNRFYGNDGWCKAGNILDMGVYPYYNAYHKDELAAGTMTVRDSLYNLVDPAAIVVNEDGKFVKMTIADAMAASKPGESVMLIRDATDEEVVIAGDVTFDKNGKDCGTIKAAEGYLLVDLGNGKYIAKTPVAEIDGGQQYDTLEKAIAAVPENQTIKMLANVALTKVLDIPADKSFTLDLNGKKISDAETGFDWSVSNVPTGTPARMMIVLRGTMKVCDTSANQDGSIWTDDFSYGTTKAVLVADNGNLTLESGTIHGEYCGCYVVGYTGDDPVHTPIVPTLTLNGGEISGGKMGVCVKGKTAILKVNEGATVIGKDHYAISTNGTTDWYDGGNCQITVNGGLVESENGVALFNPAEAIVKINGGVLKGASGIAVKGGEVTISDNASVIATGVVDQPHYVNNGIAVTGDALYIEDSYEKHKPVVSVIGGMLKSANGHAVQYWTNKAVDKIGSLSIAGGSLIAAKDEAAVLVGGSAGPVKFIKAQVDEGGAETGYPLFNSRIIPQYIAEGYIEKDNGNGTWTVTKGQAEIEVVIKPVEPTTKMAEGMTEEEKTEGKKQAEQIKENIVAALSDPSISDIVGTGIKDATYDTEGKLRDYVVNALKAAAPGLADHIDADTSVKSHVEITFESLEVKVAIDESEQRVVKSTLNKVVYEIKPILTTYITVGGDTTKVQTRIPSGQILANPIEFALSLEPSFVSELAKVTHRKDDQTEIDTKTYPVKRDGEKAYIQLAWNQFSFADIEGQSVEQQVCTVNGDMYDSVATAAAEAADGAVITLLKDIPSDVAAVPLKPHQVIELNGKSFDAPLTGVAEGYELAKTPEGQAFIAPEKIEVPTTAEEGAPKIKVRIAGMTADQLKEIQSSGRPRWADIVMGADQKLIPMVPRSPIGIGTVTIRTTLPDSTFVRTAATARDGVSVKYQLKKRVGNGDFLEYGEVQDIPVFTVDAAALEARTSWKIETIFDEEY